MITMSVALLILRLVAGLAVAALLVDVIGLFISRLPSSAQTGVGSHAS